MSQHQYDDNTQKCQKDVSLEQNSEFSKDHLEMRWRQVFTFIYNFQHNMLMINNIK